MGWFQQWWQGLGLVGQVMACAAIPMSIVMLLQLILMIIGAGFGGESDNDLDSNEVDLDSESDGYNTDTEKDTDSARILTIRGIVAFFALGGWAGLAALTAGIPALWSIQIALLSGAAAMLLASVVIRFALRMQSSGNIDLRNAVSHTADVYIAIPPSRSNTGKVTMIVQERFVELEAMTDNTESILPKTKVEVIGLVGNNCLLVRPIAEQISIEEEII